MAITGPPRQAGRLGTYSCEDDAKAADFVRASYVHAITILDTLGTLDLKQNFIITGPQATNVSLLPAFDADAPAPFVIMKIFAGTASTIKNLSFNGGWNPGGTGGGIYNRGTLTLERCEIANCQAQVGGGIANEHSLTMSQSTIHGNTATTDGGGLFLSAMTDCIANLSVVRIYENTANKGGGVAVLAGAELTAQDGSIDHNTGTVGGAGGGLYVSAGVASLTGCNIVGNTGWEGAGLENSSGTVTLVGLTVKNNTANDWGGGILAKLGATTLVTVEFDGNTAGAGGPKIAYTGVLGTSTIVDLRPDCTGITNVDIVPKTN